MSNMKDQEDKRNNQSSQFNYSMQESQYTDLNREPYLQFDDCSVEPEFNFMMNKNKQARLEKMNKDIMKGKKSAKIKDIIKFKCQLLHNVDKDLQEERKRSFKMDMTEIPTPQ